MPGDREPRWARAWVVHVVFVAAYVAGRWLALVFETEVWGFAAWFPPAGVVLAYLVVVGARWAPLAAAVRLLVVELPDLDGPLAEQLGRAVAITAGYAVAAALLRRVGMEHARLREFGWFAAIGVAGAPLVAATTVLVLDVVDGAPLRTAVVTARVLWIGDAIAVATIVPPVLIGLGVARGQRRRPRWPAGRGARVEAVVTALAVLVTPAVVLTLARPDRVSPLLALAVLPVLWVALRHDVLIASCGVLALQVVIALVAVDQLGRGAELVELQAVMLMAALAALFTGAVIHTRTEHEAELARAADEARRSAEHLRDALEVMDEGFCSLDDRGRILHANAGGVAFWSSAPALMAGPVGDLVRTAQVDRVPGVAREVRCPTDGRWYEVRVAPSTTGVVLTARDVTDQRAADQLALRVQRLEGIGTIASGMAHDLNNMLAPGVLAVDLLEEGEQHPERRELIEGIRTSLDRATGLLHQVLTFARGSEGTRADLALGELVEETCGVVGYVTRAGVELRVRHDGAPLVRGDRTQLLQVLLNLVLNACDAVGERGRVDVRVDVDSEAERAVVEVRDDGVGMPEEVRSRVFEPFFTTKPAGRGTGLGLSTAHTIVKAHGGVLSVDSAPGRGATFVVRLPAVGVSAPTTPERASRRTPADPPSRPPR